MKGLLISVLAVGTAVAAWMFVDGTSPSNRRKVPGSVFTLVKEGRVRADIVIPATPLDCERYAADELKHHIDKAFGVSIEIIREDKKKLQRYPYHIFVGATAAAKAINLPGRKLKKDEWIVKTFGNGLYLMGRDSDIKYKDIGNVWNPTIYATIYAAYDFLEKELGVKWIWPGPTGEVIPKRNHLELVKIDRTGIEPLEERILHGTAPWGMPKIGFTSEEASARFYAGQSKFLVRHRVGRRRRTKSGHAFEKWWKRFGSTHPEYFNELPGGKRCPASVGALVTLCVSEPGVWKQAVADWKDWWENVGRKNGFEPWVNSCENDYVSLCQCKKCRSWDEPDPRFAKNRYWNGEMSFDDLMALRKERGAYGLNAMLSPNRWGIPKDDPRKRQLPSIADRYARFYNEVQKEARKVNPDARVVGYGYVNYLEPPKKTKLDPSVVIEYVPRSYFPYDREESEYFRTCFLGWKNAGAKEFTYRPNYMLAGGNYPFDQGRLILEDFAFAYTNGMTACAFDSLRGSWACHAMMDYALIRAFRDPLHGYERAREELLSAFGSARDEVAKYFDGVYAYTTKWTFDDFHKISWQNSTGGNHGGGSYHNCAAILGEYFDESFFTENYKLLDSARKAAGEDREVIARIEFLCKGLRDAELTRRTRIAEKAMKAAPDDKAKAAAFDAAFKAMNDYRATVEDEFVCNFRYEARSELRMKWPHKENVTAVKPAANKKSLEY